MKYMPILTVRLTEEEQQILARRSRRAGVKRATFVRQLIRDQPYTTAAEVLGVPRFSPAYTTTAESTHSAAASHRAMAPAR